MIRDATADDATAVAGIYRPYVEGSVASFEDVPPTADELRRRIAASSAWLVFEDDGEVVGYAYAAPFHSRPAYRWSVEISIYLDGEHCGAGIGSALLDALLERLRAAGFVNAFAGIAVPNPASQRLFESRGFQQRATYPHVGYKLGDWRDVGWWQLALREPPAEPGLVGPSGTGSHSVPPVPSYASRRTNRIACLVALGAGVVAGLVVLIDRRRAPAGGARARRASGPAG